MEKRKKRLPGRLRPPSKRKRDCIEEEEELKEFEKSNRSAHELPEVIDQLIIEELEGFSSEEEANMKEMVEGKIYNKKSFFDMETPTTISHQNNSVFLKDFSGETNFRSFPRRNNKRNTTKIER